MNVACSPQTTRSLRRPRQVKPVGRATSEKHSHDGHSSMQTTDYGHVLTGPFGILSNGNSAESTISSPAPSIARDSTSYNGNALKEGYQPPLEQSNPLSHHQQSLPSLPVRNPSQPGFGITWGQAEQAVADFRVKFTPFFPFVVLDPDVSAREILLKKPLLFRAIMLAAAQLTLAKQREIKRSMLAYIGQHLLVMEERDLGLLQGLLVFIAWGEADFYFDQKITYLIYLAMGYAHNLAITRPPPTMRQKMMVVIHPKDLKDALYASNLTTVLEESHTHEEQRAFLGCQYLLSVNSSQFGRGSVLKGEYIDRCLNSLVHPTDFGADFILDKIVRFQQIVEQISEKLPAPSEVDCGKAFTISINHEMQSIRNQLNMLFANMAREHRQFVLFWAMNNYVLVRLYLPASYLTPPSDKTAADHQLQCMLYCLQAARSFFATILSIGPEGFLSRAFASFAELLFVLVAASRLLLVEIEGWDLDEARRMFDFPSTLKSLISTFKAVISLRNQRAVEAAVTFGVSLTPDNSGDEKEDRWYKYATKLDWIKTWFETRVSGGPEIPGEPQEMSGPTGWLHGNQTLSPFMFGFLGDDNWNLDF